MQLRQGSHFYIKHRPKPPFDHLWGRRLTVSVLWANGDVLPRQEFCNIRPSAICRRPPISLRVSIVKEKLSMNKLKNWLMNHRNRYPELSIAAVIVIIIFLVIL